MAPTLGLAERPLGPARLTNVTASELYRAILHGQPCPVKMLMGYGSNMLLAHADGGHGREALAALEFHMFMTPTAEVADVVLPVASCFEREALKLGFEISAEAQSLVQFQHTIVPPRGEARSDTQIAFDLAARCAKPSLFCQTQHRALPSLRKHALHPEIELHPAAAAERGIADGEWVAIATPEGTARARARFNDEIDPRVVVGQHG